MLPTAIPLLFDDAAERRLYLDGEGRPALEAWLGSLAASDFGPGAIVLADCPEGEALAARRALPARRVPAATDHPGPLCPELEAARRWFAGQAVADTDRVLAVNPKALTLTPGLLAEAVARFATTTAPALVSVTEPRDHPIQYVQYFHVQDAWCLHLLERDGGAQALAHGLPPSCVATRPFPDTMAQAPEVAAPSECTSVVRVAMTDGSSRLFLDTEAVCPDREARDRLAGVIAPSAGDQATVWLSDVDGRLEATLAEACWPLGDTMRIIPLGASGPTGPARDYRVTGDPPRLRCAPFDDDAFGALCLHLREGTDGAYDIATPFLPDDSLWRLDGTANRLVVSRTGETFCGRQDFPEILSPDGSFFLARGQALGTLPDLMRQGLAQGFVLTPDQSLVPKTLVDVLRAMVRTTGDQAPPAKAVRS